MTGAQLTNPIRGWMKFPQLDRTLTKISPPKNITRLIPESYCIADNVTPTSVALLYLGSNRVSFSVMAFSPPDETLIASILLFT
jgi:hypothetical protein